jgi:histidinol-phosphatase (PHP family)
MPLLGSVVDGHSHSQFSWDASEGAMLGSCRRAAEIGLRGIAFTEHVELTDWTLPPGMPVDPGWQEYFDGRRVRLPRFDVEPYLAMIDECRRRHPELVILSGVEISEPHWHHAEVAGLLADGRLDRVLSSVHTGPVDGGVCEVHALFALHSASDVIREYLTEVLRMVETVDVRVLAHIDYAARYWPGEAGPFDPAEFEVEHRRALAALAERRGALEINTRRPLEPEILSWWVQEGGQSVTFGCDAHAPDAVGVGLQQAAKLATRLGFHPPDNPQDPWRLGRGEVA